MNTCENCRSWQEEETIPYMGQCRRYAPRPEATPPVESPESMDAIWLRTRCEDWCGEWRAKIELGDES